MEEDLWRNAGMGRVEEVREILRMNPTLNVNWKIQNENGYTVLRIACANDCDSVVSLLLAHPDIDVNQKDQNGSTTFKWACAGGHLSCFRLLLRDPRVKVNEPDKFGFTPLWRAAHDGHFDVIQWWLASGREMDLGTPGDPRNDPVAVANKRGHTDVVTLLERFKENPEETRRAMRVKLGWYNEAAAEMFALVVFVSDGLLQIKDTATPSPAARFFAIASQLPLELQMLLCFRQVGSDKEIIPGKESEVAFKELARRLW